jgi:outer membrane protein OmpA-like peptidoglycan-associated protein
MPAGARLFRNAGRLAALLIALAGSISPAPAQSPPAAENLLDQLAGSDAAPEIDVAALRQQAVERSKARATAVAVNRPPLAPELLKLPQVSLEVLFDPDSSIIRPGSYATLGRIADVLTQPALLPYKFLIVGHTESGGRRDHNVTVSQRRADTIRDALVTTFKLSPKRLQSLGLGEEQLRDAAKPAAPANRRIQIVNAGKMPVDTPAPAPAAAKPPAKGKSGRQTR